MGLVSRNVVPKTVISSICPAHGNFTLLRIRRISLDRSVRRMHHTQKHRAALSNGMGKPLKRGRPAERAQNMPARRYLRDTCRQGNTRTGGPYLMCLRVLSRECRQHRGKVVHLYLQCTLGSPFSVASGAMADIVPMLCGRHVVK